MRDFKELEVWKDAHLIVLAVYKVTGDFTSDEQYGLVRQMRRSASSIPTNISEGCGRSSNAELKRFCDIAMGSASELEYQLLLCRDLKFISNDDYDMLEEQLVILKRRLNSFIQYLKKAIDQ